jgi:hypothetical protein
VSGPEQEPEDSHGECAAEIHRLRGMLLELAEEWPGMALQDGDTVCFFCNASVSVGMTMPDTHELDCLWRRAKEGA